MSYSTSYTESTTFTYTHARHLAAKVATDLKRIQRFYAYPTDKQIADYEAEAVELMRHGYLHSVTYGFKKDGNWIEPTLRYTAQELAAGVADDDPGRIRPGASVSGASFTSYLEYSLKWHVLSSAEQSKFDATLPFQRGNGPVPGVTGYFADDRTYSAGSVALARATVRSNP